MYIKGHYVVKQPSFKAGLKLDNFVTFNKDHSVTLKIKKEYHICLGSIQGFLRKKLDNLPFDLSLDIDSPQSVFNHVRISLKEDNVNQKDAVSASSLLIHQVGFVGYFYSIPYAGFDFNKATMYDISCFVMKISMKISRRFSANEQAQEEEEYKIDIEKEPECPEGDECSYFLKMKKCNFSNFFSDDMNDLFFEHSDHLDLEKDEEGGITFEKIKGFLFQMMNRKPQFVKEKVSKSESMLPSSLYEKQQEEQRKKKMNNIQVVAQRLGREVDFSELTEAEVKKVKAELKKIKKRENLEKIKQKRKLKKLEKKMKMESLGNLNNC